MSHNFTETPNKQESRDDKWSIC